MKPRLYVGVLVALLFVPTANWGAIPPVVNYQGLLTDGGGVPVADGSHSLFFALYDASSGGSQLWTETHPAVTTENGVFAVNLGSSNPLSISFDQQLYLAIAIDGGFELNPRMPLTAAPYALAAYGLDAGVAVTAVNGLTDDLTIAAGSNVTITPSGNTLTIDAADPGVTGVNSLNGDVTLAAGTNVTITPSGNTLTIDGAAMGVSDLNALNGSVTLGAGSNVTITPSGNTLTIDAADPGVTGVNSLNGDVTLAAGTNLTITPSGNTLTFDAAAMGVSDLNGLNGSVTLGAGSNVTITPSGNTLTIDAADPGVTGVNSLNGDVTLAAGPNVTITPSGNTLTIDATSLGSGVNSVVGGGTGNSASSNSATVGGGNSNTASSNNATVGGGLGNTADGMGAVIGGGNGNTASANNATVGGGLGNTADGMTAVIGGGNGNTASGTESVIAGGINNQATAFHTAVGGGTNNIASGTAATVPGGDSNEASGDRSFAAGRRAKANHNGAFVWADDTMADFASTAADQFIIRAGGGVGIGTNAPAAQLDVQGGGVVVGAPAGGDLGAGTINAEAVYDDNTLLSDYVLDYYFDGAISEEDRELHEGYRMLSLEETIEFMEREHHLPTIVGREEWNENGRIALGTLMSQIWETVETQALHIKELKEELDELRRLERQRKQMVATQVAELRDMRDEFRRELAEIRNLKTVMSVRVPGGPERLDDPQNRVAKQRELHWREGS